MVVEKAKLVGTNEVNFPIRQVIRQLMAYTHISEADLCRGVNLPQTTINRLLSGQTNDPRISTLAAVAQFFEISLEQLLGKDLLVLDPSFQQTKGTILPLISWENLSHWLQELSYKSLTIESWIRTEKTLNPGAFALPAPSACYTLFGQNSILIMNHVTQISTQDNTIVLVELGEQNFCLRQLLREGQRSFLKTLFSPQEMVPMNERMRIHAYVVESRCQKFVP